MRTISYIVNPAGHGGAGVKVWERVKAELGDRIDAGEVHFTERQGHAREIASSLEGNDIIAAVGGDGTVGEIFSAIMGMEEPRPTLAIIPAGTGNDIGRNLGILTLEDAMGALDGVHTRDVDLIRIDCQVDGRPGHRYSFLLGAVGFSSIPMIRPWMKRILGPTGAYYLGTFLQVMAYRAPEITVRWEDGEHSGRSWMVIVGNVARSAGGSMCLSPGARCDDGVLHTSIIPARAKLNLLTKMFPKIPSGAHVEEPDVQYFRAREIEVVCEPSVLIETDGDLFGMTPATFTICPRAVRILCPEDGG